MPAGRTPFRPCQSRKASSRAAPSKRRPHVARSTALTLSRVRMSIAAVPSPASPSVVAALLPLMAAVLIAFLVIGVAMPVLPLHVQDGLGFGPFMVGLVAGCQFAASLVARVWSGRTADARGAKLAVIAGLAAATGAGLLYLVSLNFASAPQI